MEALENTVNGMASSLMSALTPITTKRLYGQELAVFLRANYNREFDERELEGIPISANISLYLKPPCLSTALTSLRAESSQVINVFTS